MLRALRPTLPQPGDAQADYAPARARAYRAFGLVALCAAWIVLGLIGRDPWKTEDAITFATAWEMLQRSDWLVPYVAQERALQYGPLVPWLSAAGLWAFGGLLDPPDAGRLAVGLLLAALLVLTGITGRRLNGRGMSWMPVLIVVGSVGLFDRSHQLSPELGLSVAIALASYAAALASTQAARGGVLLGIATGIAFLATGWIGIVWALVPALLLPLAGESWRTRDFARFVVVALLVGTPLVAAWPYALHARDPALFTEWLHASSLAPLLPWGAYGGPDVLWLLRNVVWIAWPAIPLIVWMLWIRLRGFNGGIAQPGVIVPGVYALVILASIALMPDPRATQVLPALAPLALVASLEIDSWKREHSAALDWFGILTFGLTAIVLWAFWIDAYFNGMSPRVAILLRDTETGYGTSFNLRAFTAAAALTALWISLVRPARRSNRRAILNWAAGLTLIWGLLATIWLPYLDARRTYESVAHGIGINRPQGTCVARRDVGEAQRAAFYYFAGVVTIPEDDPTAAACPALLVQYGRLAEGTPQLPGLRILWEGSRRGDASERFVLYAKVDG